MSKKEESRHSQDKTSPRYYDVNFDYQEPSTPKVNRPTTQTSQDSQAKSSSQQLEQSLKRIKTLFQNAAEKSSTRENPYKKLPPKQAPARRPVSSTPLPTPEEIRLEREKRRAARIAELEQMATLEEVEQSHQHTKRQTTADVNKARKTEKPRRITRGSADHSEQNEQSKVRQASPTTQAGHDVVTHSTKAKSNRPMRSTLQIDSSHLRTGTSQSDVTSNKSQDDKQTVQRDKLQDDNKDVEISTTQTDSNAIKVSSDHDGNTDIQESSSHEHSNTIQASSDHVDSHTVQETSASVDNDTIQASSAQIDNNDVQISTSHDDNKDVLHTRTPQTDHSEQLMSDAVTTESEAVNSLHQSASMSAAPISSSETTSHSTHDVTSQDEKDDTHTLSVIPTSTATDIANAEQETDNANEMSGAVPTQSQDNEEETLTMSRKQKKKQKEDDLYSLTDLSIKEKIVFGFNVFFSVLKRFAIYLIVGLFLFGGVAGGIGAGYFAYLVSQTPPPSREEMAEQINRVDQQSTLYYASGAQIADIRADVVRNVTALSDISQYIIDGLVSTEDEYFYEHHGIVPKAILRATLQEIFSSGSGTGGSTLTQQLVKQQLLTNDVTFFRKANEILLALRVENHFSKDEILTAYLNISPFGRNNNGDNVAGILSASEGIFGIAPSKVNLAQAAFLVGLPQDPYTYTPYDQYGTIRKNLTPGVERMKEVLFRMYRTEKITKEQYEEAIAYDITKDFLPTERRNEERQTYLYQAMMNGAIEQIMRLNIADQGLTWEQVNADVDWYNEFYFAAEEQLRTGGYKVYTTIDKDIYDQLQATALEYKDQLGAAYDGVYTNSETGEETYYVETVQSGVVVMDNTTGRVLGFVSGTDYENNQIDHAFNMRRSPGSTIKPLAVYGPAIEHNMINPSTVIPDTAFEQTFEDGTTWTPTNYGGVVSGTMMTARTALLRSDNLPAVRVYQALLEQNIPIFEYMKKMGFDTLDAYTEDDTKNLAFSLGGVTTGPTVFEQTRAFTTFANNGQYIGGYFIERIEDAFGNIVYQYESKPVQVFAEDTNYLMVDMLRDTNTEGTGRTAAELLTMGGDWIAKSGISENSRDVWYIASTPKITIGTWIGYDNRYVDYYIDINDGFDRESVRVQRYWAALANNLYAKFPDIFGADQTFTMPNSVQETAVVQNTGTLPGTINANGTNISITQPLVNEVFKLINPAPALSYNFIFGATDAETQNFWAGYIAQVQEAKRRQRENQNNTSSNQEESRSSEEENNDDQNEQNEPPQTEIESTTTAP